MSDPVASRGAKRSRGRRRGTRARRPASNGDKHHRWRPAAREAAVHQLASEVNDIIISDIANGNPAATGDSMMIVSKASQLADEMALRFKRNQYQCAICIEIIRASAAIFSCSSCTVSFHLECSRRWLKSQGGSWRCPNCQFVTDNRKELPSSYFCFCGSVRNPAADVELPAHSCGLVCGKKKRCPHPCTLQCHPGPCPECPAVVNVRCGCNRTNRDVRCHHRTDSISCQQVCRRLLSCRRHTCREICHSGPCTPCSAVLTLTCHCGLLTNSQPCGDAPVNRNRKAKPSFSCGAICSRPLNCGRHNCEELCHEEPCQPCQRLVSDPQICACGKTSMTPINRTTCLDPLPTCLLPCGRARPDCPHPCPEICHDSVCPPCQEPVVILCRCGRETQSVPCPQYSGNLPLCTAVCNVMQSCGKHRCRQICCQRTGSAHPCPQPCSKLLSCGLHQCHRNCHQSPCPPCGQPLPSGLSCACGAQRIQGPVQCGTAIPDCRLPCTKVKPCGHPCHLLCHTGPCPKCLVLVKRMCAGQHVELTAVPCSAAPTSCGHQCNHPQSCLHPCSKVCHVHDSDTQCKECNAPITSMCPCGRRSQRISKSSILSELECDEQCLVQLRNQNLASALQVEPVGPNRPQAPAPVPWSTPILQLAQTYSRFVLSIEHQMANLIMSESVGGAYMDPVSGPRLFLLRHMAAQYGLFCETYTEAQRSCLRLTRQGAKSAVLPSFLQLSRVAALFAKCPSSVIPKAAASSLCETSAIPAVQFSGVAEGGAALIQRLVSSWRQTYAVASRWIDSQTVVIAFGSLAGLQAALADVDESTLVYADAATPPAAVAEEMCQSLSSAPFGTGRGRLSRQAAVSAIGRPANIWDTLPSEDTVPDTWDS